MRFLCYLCPIMRQHLSATVSWALSLLLAAAAVSGCDLVRASLGKPTSADLAALRMAKEAREQAVRDSLSAVEAERARIAAEQAAAAAEGAVLRTYYAVAGAFKDSANAQIYVDRLHENGFRVRVFDFKSGLKVVCVDGSDSLSAVRRDVAALKRLHIAPSDPWIYNTNQKLHKQI